jgi:carboxypeptidase C (cathepsin A)
MFFCGTGFSREEAGMDTTDFCGVTSDAFPSRTGFSREEAGMNTMDFCGVTSDAFPAEPGPTVNAKPA